MTPPPDLCAHAQSRTDQETMETMMAHEQLDALTSPDQLDALIEKSIHGLPMEPCAIPHPDWPKFVVDENAADILIRDMSRALIDLRYLLATSEAARAETAAGAYEAAAQTVDMLGDSAVTEALGTRLCCSGHMCGCQGSDVGAYILHHIRALTDADAIAALEARDKRVREKARKVKPLVWKVLDDGTAWSNVTDVGLRYYATHLGWCHRNGALNDADGVEAAKAAAQADYEARILSALIGGDA